MAKLTWDNVLPLLDLHKVAEQIAAVEGRALLNPEFEDVKELVLIAGRTWLVRDLVDFNVQGLEEEVFIDDIPGQRTQFHGFVDLKGTLTGKGTEFLKPYAGRVVVLDWKTTKSQVETDWKKRLINSWQWQIYSHATDARIFMYRGISLTYKTTNEVILQVPHSNSDEVRTYLAGKYRERQALVDGQFPVWPMTKQDYACKSYGRDCPYLEDCKDYNMPQQAIEDRQLSYSSISTFAMCEERHRRDTLAEGKDESDATVMGTAFHRGMEALYDQGRRLIQQWR